MYKYKIKDNINIEDKPRVFFSCHPDDFSQYFESISDEILDAHDCAIYYDTEEPTMTTEERRSRLLEMNLIVFPITAIFLDTSCSAYNIDFTFAIESGIPILPIITD